MFGFMLLGGLAFGQTSFQRGNIKNVTPANGHKAYPAVARNANMQAEALPFIQTAGETAQAIQSAVRGTDDVVGTTGYDLQTNNGIMRRLATRSNGDVSVAWTFNPTAVSGWPDRGTGYNVRKSGTWGTAPTARLEGATRTGFTNLHRLNGQKDLVVAHGGSPLAPVVTIINDDGTKNTQMLQTVSTGALWFRVATEGNTIHIIGITNPGTASAPTPYLGVAGHLLYWRSKDGGTTWDKQASVIQGIDSTLYKTGLTADSYSISARNGRVAIGMFNTWNNSDIFISENGGDSFTKLKTVFDFPLDNYVVNSGYDASALPPGSGTVSSDSTAVLTTDNTGNVLIDLQGLVHCVFSTTNVTDQNLTDAGWTYYPASSGMYYWNEGMAEAEQILPNLFDFNGDGLFESPDNPDAAIRTYGAAATTDGQLSIDENGSNIYMTFRTAYEFSVYTTDNEHLNHTFVIGSKDGGMNWDGPVDLFWPGFYNGDNLYHTLAEGAYASMEEVTKGTMFRVVYQRDYEPDTYVNSLNGGEMHQTSLSDIVYFDIPKSQLNTLLTTGVETVEPATFALHLSPNPSSNNTNLTFKLGKSAQVSVELLNVMGQSVRRTTPAQYGAGISQINLNTSDLASGVYFVRFNAGNQIATTKLVVRQ